MARNHRLVKSCERKDAERTATLLALQLECKPSDMELVENAALPPMPDRVVKQGTWFYDSILCDVCIVRADVRPGTGDYEDEPEWQDDQPGLWFEIRYGSPTERGNCNGYGGSYSTLEEAMAKVEKTVNGVSWSE